jgi:hypothetical protein
MKKSCQQNWKKVMHSSDNIDDSIVCIASRSGDFCEIFVREPYYMIILCKQPVGPFNAYNIQRIVRHGIDVDEIVSISSRTLLRFIILTKFLRLSIEPKLKESLYQVKISKIWLDRCMFYTQVKHINNINTIKMLLATDMKKIN